MIEKIKNINDAFHRYHCNHRSIIDAKFREKGLYFGQPPILKFISENTNATQKEIADNLGISQSYISRLEKRIMLRLKKEILRQTSCV